MKNSANKIDKQSSVPRFCQLIEILKKVYIDNREYKSDTIPSILTLCKEYDLSKNTVEKAISELVKAGKLSTEVGKGILIKKNSVGYEKRSKVKNILLLSEGRVTGPISFYQSIIFTGIQGTCIKMNISLNHLILDPDNPFEVISQHKDFFLNEGTGIIISVTSKRILDLVKYLKDNKKPLCTISNQFASELIPNVDIDFKGGFLKGTKKLITYGHKEIAFLSQQESDSTTVDKLAGFKKAHQLKKLPVNDKLIIQSGKTAETYNGWQLTNKLIKSKEKFTAIICANDQMALGTIVALKENNIRIPQDVSVIGCDNNPTYIRCFPPFLSTIAYNGRQAGKNAFFKLFNPKKNIPAVLSRVILSNSVKKL